MDADYKLKKEAFVSGHTGAPLSYICLVTVVAPLALLTNRCAQHMIAVVASARTKSDDDTEDEVDGDKAPAPVGLATLPLLIDFVTLVLPMVLSVMVPSHLLSLIAGLAGVSVFLIFMGFLAEGFASGGALETDEKAAAQRLNRKRAPYLTAYRAYMMFGTAVAILAVDFPAFPRIHAKTETFGTALMDAGVGSFMLSKGLVTAVPTVGIVSRLKRATKEAGPLFVLGMLRLISVKSTDYQEHVSEYGVHWNFFFTLAAVTLLYAVVAVPRQLCLPLSLVVCGVYEWLLVGPADLQDYILNAPRDNLLSMNREGVFSGIGYTVLFTIGVWLGAWLRTPRKSHQWRNTLLTLVAVDGGLWAALSLISTTINPPSRRMLNMAYVVWIVAHNLLLLISFLAVEWFVRPYPAVNAGTHSPLLSPLLNAINTNLIECFLVANLGTGLVNLSIDTLAVSDSIAVLAVTVYMFSLCAFVLGLSVWKRGSSKASSKREGGNTAESSVKED